MDTQEREGKKDAGGTGKKPMGIKYKGPWSVKEISNFTISRLRKVEG